jgi:HPr kinase/phosphorylase
VADDQVVLSRDGDALVARAPAAIAGVIEVRGIGLLRVPAADAVPLVLAVDLNQTPEARMPQKRLITYLGVSIELIFGQGIPDLGVALSIFVQNGRAFPE